jgi:hypothetical protein
MWRAQNVVKAWFKEKFYNEIVGGEFYYSGYILTSYLFDWPEKTLVHQ